MELAIGDLRPGRGLEDVANRLRRLAQDVENKTAGGGQSVDIARIQYLDWVDGAEVDLRSWFTPASIWQALHTDRYWRVHQLDESSPRPHPVIRLEAKYQAERLCALAEQLDAWTRLLSMPGCVAVVPDTNVLLHCERYDQVDWPSLVKAKCVRLVLPLIVLDELDDISNRRQENRAERARAILRAMQKHRAGMAPETPAEIRAGVTMQVLVEPPRHVRWANNDSEIIRWVEAFGMISDNQPLLATQDYGMQLRAMSRGVKCLIMPETLRLTRAASTDDE